VIAAKTSEAGDGDEPGRDDHGHEDRESDDDDAEDPLPRRADDHGRGRDRDRRRSDHESVRPEEHVVGVRRDDLRTDEIVRAEQQSRHARPEHPEDCERECGAARAAAVTVVRRRFPGRGVRHRRVIVDEATTPAKRRLARPYPAHEVPHDASGVRK